MSDPRPRPRQQGLFGPIDEPPHHSAPRPVAPAVVPAELAALAAGLPHDLRIGTSSWAFPGWRGLVYSADSPTRTLSRDGLAAYAKHPLLRAVGVDRSFYAPLDRAAFAAMAAAVPADFRFVVKAFADCTTPFRRDTAGQPAGANPRWLDPHAANALVVEPAMTGLAERLAAIVFQFPPQGDDVVREPARFAARLHAFGAGLPPGLPWVVELRDPELLTAEQQAALRAVGGRHCYAVHARMPSLARQLEIAPVDGPVVLRWMLQPGLRYEQAKARYEPFARLVDADPGQRRAIADLSVAALLRGLPVTIVINNKAEGSAPLSAVELARAIAALRA